MFDMGLNLFVIRTYYISDTKTVNVNKTGFATIAWWNILKCLLMHEIRFQPAFAVPANTEDLQ